MKLSKPYEIITVPKASPHRRRGAVGGSRNIGCGPGVCVMFAGISLSPPAVGVLWRQPLLQHALLVSSRRVTK